MTEENAAANKANLKGPKKQLTDANKRAYCPKSSTSVHRWFGKAGNPKRFACQYCLLEKEVFQIAHGYEVKYYKDGVEVTEQPPTISVDESGA